MFEFVLTQRKPFKRPDYLTVTVERKLLTDCQVQRVFCSSMLAVDTGYPSRYIKVQNS